MTTIWIVWNQFQSHEYNLDCAKITNQSHEFYLECAFFTNQRREFYLDQLYYSALKSRLLTIAIALPVWVKYFVIITKFWKWKYLFEPGMRCEQACFCTIEEETQGNNNSTVAINEVQIKQSWTTEDDTYNPDITVLQYSTLP